MNDSDGPVVMDEDYIRLSKAIWDERTAEAHFTTNMRSVQVELSFGQTCELDYVPL